MGVCSSCLGGQRRQGLFDTSETARLLYEEPQQSQYGALNGGATPVVAQADPQDVQREELALRHILAQTTDNLIDVFALFSLANDAALPTYPSHDESKSEQYRRLLGQTAALGSSPGIPLLLGEMNSQTRQPTGPSVGELPHDPTLLPKYVKRNEVGKLVGEFSTTQTEKRTVKGSKR